MGALMRLMRKRWIRELIRPSLYLRRRTTAMLASIPLLQVVRLLTWPAAQVLGARGFVIIPVLASRLGHLIVEPLIASALLTENPRTRRILLVPSEGINSAVTRLWAQHFRVVRSPFLCFLLEGMARNRRVGFDIWSIASDPGRERLYALVGRTGQLAQVSLRPTVEDDAGRQELLEGLGVGSREYVCISYRPNVSADTAGAPDQVDMSLRWRSVEQMLIVARAVRDAGFVPVLMGGRDQPAIEQEALLVNYPHSDFKSPIADVLLAQGCRAWIGDTSGASTLALLFGKPRLLLDYIPFATALNHGPNDTVVPMVLIDIGTTLPLDLLRIQNPRVFTEFQPEELRKLNVKAQSAGDSVISESIHDFLQSLESQPSDVHWATKPIRKHVEGLIAMPTGSSSVARAYLNQFVTGVTSSEPDASSE